MTDKEALDRLLAELALMRKCQKAYFKAKNKGVIDCSSLYRKMKRAQSVVDATMKDIEIMKEEQKQAKLFA